MLSSSSGRGTRSQTAIGFLCSDGLYGALTQKQIVEHLKLSTPEAVNRGLIAAARAAAANENVSAVIVDAHRVAK